MNNEQIKQLETELWGAADGLRANSKLTAAEYKDPVLGLILLRYAQNRYDEAKIAIEASMPADRVVSVPHPSRFPRCRCHDVAGEITIRLSRQPARRRRHQRGRQWRPCG